MSDRLERVLEILDAGAQSSPEPSYGTDLRPGFCVRCQGHDPAPDGELCGGCRAFLLGDTDEDPCTAVVAVDPAEFAVAAQRVAVALGMTIHEAAESVRRFMQIENGEP